jgi:hypothetical protein
VLAAARGLPAHDAPMQAQSPASPAAPCTLHDALAQLLDLLQNNNMKAMAQFEALRPALDPALAGRLADAVATLRFDAAAALVRGILDTKEDA